MRQPKVSIITVCYNAKDTIEGTINSVREQVYENIEYIIIDGNSTDGTKEIILQNYDAVTRFISEPDNGLYFAMNKGLDVATGEYVWFLNAGDRIPHSNTLLKIMTSSYMFQDIYYGHTKIIDKKGRVKGDRRLKPPVRLTKDSFKWGMLVCHQAAIVKTKLVRHYNTKYKIAADFDWLLTAIENSDPAQIRYSSRTYCHFLEGGLSSRKMFQANRERYAIMIKHYGFIRATFYNFLMLFRFIKSKIAGEL
ncbi:MAG: glycosyltransferase [Bacteroidales bacterium]|nr:glycosyltransferase [Bacteroidales bacterium]